MRGIIWFREDLRTIDNTALHAAAKQCHDGLIALYVIDPAMWVEHHVASCRVEFILRGLHALHHELHKLNIPFRVIAVEQTRDIPERIAAQLIAFKADALFFNRQYEVNESRRDQLVQASVKQQGIAVYSFDDQTILPPGSVNKKNGEFYSIFTPFKREWQHTFLQKGGCTTLLPIPKKQTLAFVTESETAIPRSVPGFSSTVDACHWPAGQQAASQRLDHFLEQSVFLYHQRRDFPALDGTSQLSPYLATGMISPRQCFAAAMTVNNHELDTGDLGVLTWMTELIWREFYKHILVAVPRVSMNKAYQQATEKLPWRYDEKLLTAWQTGMTGFPLVDAAMRQLNTLGWMHNRLRMVTAMFLSKNLFLDWRLGESYFMQHLIDGDLSANNGGWQWSASTGTDAVPYFRMFNPLRQSERFDPQGEFIRTYCPELAEFNAKTIHEPYTADPALARRCHYPEPIIDISRSRERVMAAFKSL